jgi:anthranilate synthase/aminodeoxychorismate synthase-like glutamine amidotransferase
MSTPNTGPTIILDNYDSFTFNLFQQVAGLQEGVEPLVFRNDALSVDDLRELDPAHIIISPGPGHPARPEYMGICLEVINELGPDTPILGVCLGHLAMIQALGGTVVQAAPRHGKTSPVHHHGTSVFTGLPDPVEVMRYHSLVGRRDDLPAELEITAWTADGLIMGVRHRQWPMVGVQFHPESIGTARGDDLVRNFLAPVFD